MKMSSEGSEDSFAFESLVGYLRGPIWNIPILTFIENKSLVFEPDSYDDDIHKKIHEEYKNLVDFMLGSHMEDMGIEPQQFEAACGKASPNIKDKFHQILFEQVWAADDYDIFQRMMIQKNIELQLQALELLQKKHGIIPESFIPADSMSQEEQEVMEQVIKKSLEEYEAYKQTMDSEIENLEKAIALSSIENSRLEEQNVREKELLKDALSKSSNERTPHPPPPPPPASTTESDLNNEDVARRREYLRGQRDKLLEMKRIEREKQLQNYEQTHKQSRPKSSRAARRVLKGVTIDPQTLQLRRALAERLKAEVIRGQ